MKLTPKRKRSDSAAAAIAATQAAALPPLEPPAHVLVLPPARPFWAAIVLA
ncbi:MAG: terminase, partial [Comamonadaceae bacterium]